MRTGKFFLPALLLLAGCADGTGAADPSWFRAELSGEVTDRYEGTGDFSFDRDDGDTPHFFRITSAGFDPAIQEAFHLRWPDDRRPQPGAYPLVPHTNQYGSTRGVTAVYRWSRGDNVSAPAGGELYVAEGGAVEITRSTSEEVEGTIRFSGIQVTKTGPVYRERDDPRHQPDPGAPRIEVSGTFRVTRFDAERVSVKNH